jgi:GTP:adenosylcobinamide-phosphate guanylyltransferase
VSRWTAFLLAGSRPSGDPLARSMMLGHKALIPIAGERMVRRPVGALLESDAIGKVLVLSQAPQRIADALPKNARLSMRESQGTIAETIENLILSHSADFPLLVTTADHALLDKQMIAEFIAKAEGADVAVGVVERQSLLARLPQTKRTWIAFRGGAYSGANLFAFGSIKALAAIEQWRSVEQDRKKGWRIVSLLGPVVLIGTALHLLSIDDVLARLGRKIGLRVHAVRLSNPLAGVDVDKAEDHALAEAILKGEA